MAVSVDAPRGFAQPLRSLVKQVLEAEERRVGDITVVLSDDATLRALNRQWRGLDKATDVLSFAYDEHDDDAAALPVTGDLVISMDRVREQARRYRVTEGEELARLVIHGVLHLCGHDHMKPAERSAMREREDRAMRRGRAEAASFTRALAPPRRRS